MTPIPFTSISLREDGSWLFDWTPTGATFYRVALDGNQIGAVLAPPYSCELPGFLSYPPSIEVAEEGLLTPSEQYPPYLVMQWYTESCDFYTLSDEGSGQFVTVTETNRSFVWTFQTGRLNDQSTHVYDLKATGDVGQDSSIAKYSVYVVTPPLWVDEDVKVTYDKPSLSVVVSAP